jgi:hypothetical protein
VSIIRYIALTNLFGQDVIFHFNLVASKVFEYNFSQKYF